MWATKQLFVNDAYQQFHIILYRWLHIIGLALGRDIFHDDFKINSQTVFVLMMNVSIPLLLFLTYYRFDNELGMMAGTFVLIGFKVWYILIFSNAKLES